jgi:hypothetical protein
MIISSVAIGMEIEETIEFFYNERFDFAIQDCKDLSRSIECGDQEDILRLLSKMQDNTIQIQESYAYDEFKKVYPNIIKAARSGTPLAVSIQEFLNMVWPTSKRNEALILP